MSVSCRSAEAFDSQSLDVLLKCLNEVLVAEPFKQVLVGLSGGRFAVFAAGRHCAFAFSKSARLSLPSQEDRLPALCTKRCVKSW